MMSVKKNVADVSAQLWSEILAATHASTLKIPVTKPVINRRRPNLTRCSMRSAWTSILDRGEFLYENEKLKSVSHM